jgi:WD40 repeat protein
MEGGGGGGGGGGGMITPRHKTLELEPGVYITSQEVVWNSAGEKLAVGLNNKQILIWDAYKNTQMRILTSTEYSPDNIVSIAWDPSRPHNDMLACLIREGVSHLWKIKIWNAKFNNDLIISHDASHFMADYETVYHKIKWAPNGEFILCVGIWEHKREYDKSYYGVLKWNKCTNYTDKLLLFKKNIMYGLSPVMVFSPDSQVLAFGLRFSGLTKHGYVYLIDTNNGDTLKTIVCERGEPEKISWSHNGNMLLTCGGDNVNIWSVDTQKIIRTIKYPHPYWSWTYTSIEWNYLNDMLAISTATGVTESASGNVTIWRNYKLLLSFDVLGINYLAWNPNEPTVLATAGNNKIQVWEVLPPVTATDIMQREWKRKQRRLSALFFLTY